MSFLEKDWMSSEVSEIKTDDEESKRRLHQFTRRVDLGRKSASDKTPWPLIYPCMLDVGWYAEYMNGNGGVLTQKNDPKGWAPEGESLMLKRIKLSSCCNLTTHRLPRLRLLCIVLRTHCIGFTENYIVFMAIVSFSRHRIVFTASFRFVFTAITLFSRPSDRFVVVPFCPCIV